MLLVVFYENIYYWLQLYSMERCFLLNKSQENVCSSKLSSLRRLQFRNDTRNETRWGGIGGRGSVRIT